MTETFFLLSAVSMPSNYQEHAFNIPRNLLNMFYILNATNAFLCGGEMREKCFDAHRKLSVFPDNQGDNGNAFHSH